MAENIVGVWLLPAIIVAALVALCNGLSSAQCAAAHTRAGGTYEYGYAFISPAAGFVAGWLFLLAKSASAATAALAVATYLPSLLGVGEAIPITVTALSIIAAMTILVLGGVRRSNLVNAVLVGLVIAVLATFVAQGIPRELQLSSVQWPKVSITEFCYAAALLFVAFTGYGRIATMAEEVREPKRFIPAAILITLAVIVVLYLGVGIVLVSQGMDYGSQVTKALELAAAEIGSARLVQAVSIAALVAMLGVLLNLIIGLSRVALAMARRSDLPSGFMKLRGGEPVAATIFCGVIIAGLAMLGDVKLAWSFSAITVLIYYTLTNIAALRMPQEQRMFPRAVSWAGLVGCLSLAIFVPPIYWLWTVAALAPGLAWHYWRRSRLSNS